MRGGLGLFIVVWVALGVSPAALAAGQPRDKRIRGVARKLPKKPTRAAPPPTEPLSTPTAATPAETLAHATASPPPMEIDQGNAISLEVPHPFARAGARERVSQLLQFWREAYGVVSEWRGDRVFLHGRVHGVAIHALFDVSDGVVSAVARDPGWFWRARAQSYVEWMLRKYLHPTYQEPAEGW